MRTAKYVAAETWRRRDEIDDEHLGSGRLIELELTNVLDDADDFPRAFPAIDLSPEGRSIEKAAVREGATDQRLAPGRSPPLNVRPWRDAQSHGLDEPRTHRVQAGIRALGTLTGRKGPWTDVTREPLLNQRQVVRIANRGDTGQSCQSRNESIGEGHALGTRQTQRRGLKRQDVRRVVSTLDIRQPQKAVNQQRATDQQHHRHRDLGYHESAANAMTHLLLAEEIHIALSRLAGSPE